LPVLSGWFGVGGSVPFVESEFDVMVSRGLDEPGEFEEFLLGESLAACGDNCGDVEAADEGPDSAVVVLSGHVVGLVAGHPVGVERSDEREEAGGQVAGEVAGDSHRAALGFDP